MAAARGIRLTEVESRVHGDLDVRGLLGVSDEHRTGFERIRAELKVKGEAEPHELRALVQRAKQRAPVYDMLANGVPVEIAVTAP